MKKAVLFLTSIMGIFTVDLSAYEFKAGDYVVMEYAGYQMRVDVKNYNKRVNGYKAMRLIDESDYYGGGSYVANVPGVGWSSVGTDVHDAMTAEYLGIESYMPPCPYYGGIEYGAEVGTKEEWRGYTALDDEEPEDYDRTVWEVVGYEDVSVPYGDFTDAMKMVIKEYYSYEYYYEELDPYSIPEYDWELSESCSEYVWIVPTIGVVQVADYDYYGEEGPYPLELVSCKVNGKANPAAEEPAGPAELTLSLTGTKIPASVLSGTDTKLTLQAEISNAGGSDCAKGEEIDLLYYAMNIETEELIELGNTEGFSISNLKAGRSKKARATVYLPGDVSEGTYDLIVVSDDMEAVYDGDITVAEGYVDLALEVTKYKLPTAMIAGTSSRCSIDLLVTNNGNISTGRTDVETVEIYAESQVGPNAYLLTTTEARIGNMKPGKSKKVRVSVEFPSDLPEDDYSIAVYFGDSMLAIEDLAIQVSEPFVNFDVELASSDIPSAIIAGTGANCDLKLNVSNTGNISSARDEELHFDIIAISQDDSSEQVLLAEDIRLGNLRPAKSKSVKLPIEFPANISEGDYDIAICYNDAELMLDTSVNISEPYIELTGTIDDMASSSIILAGEQGGVEISLEITNTGNDTTANNQTIDIDIYGKPEYGEEILIETITDQNIGRLKSGQSKKLKLSAAVPASLETGSYQLSVYIDSGDDISENNEEDNWLTSESAFNMTIVGSLEDIMEPSKTGNSSYSTVVKGDYFYGSGPAIVTGVFDEYFEFEDDYEYDEHSNDISWQQDGVYFYGYDIGGGWAHYYFEPYEGVLLTSNELALNTTIKSTQTGYVEHRIYGLNFDFEATVSSEFEIDRMENVKVNGVTYQAYKINWSYVISGSDVMDLTDIGEKAYNYTDTFQQDVTYWAVPGVGVVKQRSKGQLKLSVRGMGTDTWTFDYTKELIQ